MEERIQVHHNYISAISNLEHKKDLINRLKRSDPHNILAYEAEMTHQMVLHDDVLGRILTILKQDDYYRTLQGLPVIDSLTTYEDIKLFPELYDTITIIERVTGEADLIERQLRQPVCRHMERPIILGTDFTSMNFVGAIWTHEGTRKMI